MYQKLNTAGQYIQSVAKIRPRVGVILGSGLGSYIDQIEDKQVIPYQEIPYFRPTTVDGHEGRLILGLIGETPVAVLQGRLHAYEGHSMEEVVFPVRVLATLGIETLILTNAAGGINPHFTPGDLVLINDHINLMGTNPLVGPNIAELGPRFPDMTEAYGVELRQHFSNCAQKLGINLKNGIYCSLLGPTYETPAEIRMLRVIGADMVGMSTVPEAIAANHLGLKVAGISCITNMAAGLTEHKLNHEEVKREAKKTVNNFSQLLNLALKSYQ